MTRTVFHGDYRHVGADRNLRPGTGSEADLDLLLAKLRVDIAAVTASQADIARKA